MFHLLVQQAMDSNNPWASLHELLWLIITQRSRADIFHVYMICDRLDVCWNNVSPSFIPCLYSFQYINPHGSRKPVFFFDCLHQEWSDPPSLPFCFPRHLVTMATGYLFHTKEPSHHSKGSEFYPFPPRRFPIFQFEWLLHWMGKCQEELVLFLILKIFFLRESTSLFL